MVQVHVVFLYVGGQTAGACVLQPTAERCIAVQLPSLIFPYMNWRWHHRVARLFLIGGLTPLAWGVASMSTGRWLPPVIPPVGDLVLVVAPPLRFYVY